MIDVKREKTLQCRLMKDCDAVLWFKVNLLRYRMYFFCIQFSKINFASLKTTLFTCKGYSFIPSLG